VYDAKNPPPPASGYRGRFAPSPTGPLHAGSLVAALGSWLDAKNYGGQWLLRIEDIDKPRCIPGADLEIMRQLLACGLQWDEEVTWQAERQEGYQRALEALNQQKCVYSCTCSRQMIANTLATQGIQTPRNQEIVYPGTCRPAQMKINSLSNMAVAWRLVLPKDLMIEFDDEYLGTHIENVTTQVGDFVLRRNDGLFTYQLAVVVDDAEQNITHIVRGQDLLSNTARQIYLQTLLGYNRPQYLHLPLVLDEYGEKLSKQTLATQINTQDSKSALAELRQAASHLGLQNLSSSKDISIAEWLLAATHAWSNRSNQKI
jgi:glutamyl-Q tRNA(Asp) synthetase